MALLAAGMAQADPLIFGTGTGAPGIADQHYRLIVFPGVYPQDIPTDLSDFGTLPAYRLLQGRAPGNWLSYGASVHWIAPQVDYVLNGTNSDPWGTYVFRTTFDLTGYDPSTAVIQGAWSSDNCGYDIRINGYSTGDWGMVIPQCLSTRHEFTIGPSLTVQNTLGLTTTYSQVMPFVAGVNTIEFVLQNFACSNCPQNPAGIAVEISGTYGEYLLPEPNVWALVSVGVLALFLRMCKAKYSTRS